MHDAVPLRDDEYVEFRPHSLAFRPDTPREVWAEVFTRLKAANRSVQWWIGDAFAFGEKKYGEEVWQYLERSEKTLANWASVCRQIPPHRRREGVMFSQHAEVAKLEPAEQEMVLGEVQENGWSVTRTRERAAEVEQERVADGRTVEVVEEHALDDEPQGAQVSLIDNAFICKECGALNELGVAAKGEKA